MHNYVVDAVAGLLCISCVYSYNSMIADLKNQQIQFTEKFPEILGNKILR